MAGDTSVTIVVNLTADPELASCLAAGSRCRKRPHRDDVRRAGGHDRSARPVAGFLQRLLCHRGIHFDPSAGVLGAGRRGSVSAGNDPTPPGQQARGDEDLREQELASCHVLDWATVASGAITGVVGIAGIAGAIIAAKVAGNSATQSAWLGIGAESDRVRLAEKRRVCARAMAALDAGYLATQETAFVSTASATAKAAKPSDEAAARLRETVARVREATAEWKAALESAMYAVGELQLITPPPAGELASRTLESLTTGDPPSVPAPKPGTHCLWPCALTLMRRRNGARCLSDRPQVEYRWTVHVHWSGV